MLGDARLAVEFADEMLGETFFLSFNAKFITLYIQKEVVNLKKNQCVVIRAVIK